VTSGGSDRVSSGSTTARRASRWELGDVEHGVAGHLGARARRGGDGDERHAGREQRLTPAHQLQVIQDLSRVGEQARHGLPGVDHAAPALGDHQVAALAAGDTGGLVHQMGGGFPAHVEDHRAHAGVTQPLRQRLAPAVGAPQDHEGPTAEVPGQGGDLPGLAATEEDASGGGELECHGSPSPG
jgi:hypothetical protein